MRLTFEVGFHSRRSTSNIGRWSKVKIICTFCLENVLKEGATSQHLGFCLCASVKTSFDILNYLATQDWVLNDYQGRLASWFWGCCKRREYLKSLARRLDGEKLRISLEKDVSIIQNEKWSWEKKQRGVMFEHNVYNQFIPTPAQAEQNCNIMTFQGDLL